MTDPNGAAIYGVSINIPAPWSPTHPRWGEKSPPWITTMIAIPPGRRRPAGGHKFANPPWRLEQFQWRKIWRKPWKTHIFVTETDFPVVKHVNLPWKNMENIWKNMVKSSSLMVTSGKNH